MSKKANVLIVSSGDFNVDFLERAVTSRYKLLDRGKIYTVDKAFEKIEQHRPDVIIVNSMLPQYSDQHDKLLCSINELKDYSPDIIFTYCMPNETEDDYVKSILDKMKNADVRCVLNLCGLSDSEFADTLKCIIENDGKNFDVGESDIDESILEKEREELLRKWGMQ